MCGAAAAAYAALQGPPLVAASLTTIAPSGVNAAIARPSASASSGRSAGGKAGAARCGKGTAGASSSSARASSAGVAMTPVSESASTCTVAPSAANRAR